MRAFHQSEWLTDEIFRGDCSEIAWKKEGKAVMVTPIPDLTNILKLRGFNEVILLMATRYLSPCKYLRLGTREKVRSTRINLEGNTHAQEINVSQLPV
jgi:hypothetical protein